LDPSDQCGGAEQLARLNRSVPTRRPIVVTCAW